MFFFGEMYELVYIFIGYFFCGCWGVCDFNVWGFCEGCCDVDFWVILVIFVGFIFIFVFIWLGCVWLLCGDFRR